MIVPRLVARKSSEGGVQKAEANGYVMELTALTIHMNIEAKKMTTMMMIMVLMTDDEEDNDSTQRKRGSPLKQDGGPHRPSGFTLALVI